MLREVTARNVSVELPDIISTKLVLFVELVPIAAVPLISDLPIFILKYIILISNYTRCVHLGCTLASCAGMAKCKISFCSPPGLTLVVSPLF
jgi:hypothetical protein